MKLSKSILADWFDWLGRSAFIQHFMVYLHSTDFSETRHLKFYERLLESPPEVKDERREMVYLIAARQSDTTMGTSLYRDDYYRDT
jgi:hypothetical protein